MPLSIEPVDPNDRSFFAGRATGIDLSQALDEEDVAAVVAGMDRYGVLVFPDQDLGDKEVLNFSLNFGELERPVADLYKADKEQIAQLTNLDEEGHPLKQDDPRRYLLLASRFWHTDSSFRPAPAKYTFLSARIIPDADGETEFADMRAAYDTLSPEMKTKVDDLVCLHSASFCRSLLGLHEQFASEKEAGQGQMVERRLVQKQPNSDRKSLYFGVHTGKIAGWSDPESRLFLWDLTEHATQRELVYRHVWHKGDLVMWDNRITLHRARPYDPLQIREFSRATVVVGAGEFEGVA